MASFLDLDSDSGSSVASPRKRGPPPRLSSAVPSASVHASLSDIQSMSSGLRADVTVAIESVLPCKTVSGPKFTGEFTKAMLIDSTSEPVILTGFGASSQLLQQLVVGKTYSFCGLRLSFNRYGNKMELVLDDSSTISKADSLANYRSGSFEELKETPCILRIDCIIMKTIGFPVYTSCAYCKKKRAPESEVCIDSNCGCEDWCYRFAMTVTLSDQSSPAEHRVTFFEDLAQEIIGVALNDEAITLIDDLTVAWNALAGKTLSLACRGKKSQTDLLTIVPIALCKPALPKKEAVIAKVMVPLKQEPKSAAAPASKRPQSAKTK